MQTDNERKTERIDLRTTSGIKQTLRRAAAARNKTVTEFVLDVAMAEAAAILAEQRRFVMDDAQWEAFTTALDGPGRPRPHLERLLTEPGVFK